MAVSRYENRDTASLLTELRQKAEGNDDLEGAMECAIAVLSSSICTFLVGSFAALDQLRNELDPNLELFRTTNVSMICLLREPHTREDKNAIDGS